MLPPYPLRNVWRVSWLTPPQSDAFHASVFSQVDASMIPWRLTCGKMAKTIHGKTPKNRHKDNRFINSKFDEKRIKRA